VSEMGLTVISIKLPMEMLKKIDAIALLEGKSRSEIIRKAIIEYLIRKGYVMKLETVKRR